MCKHGTTVKLEITIGSEKVARPIDSCIARIVLALEKENIRMEGSCCGHGRNPGQIILADGRVLTIMKNLASSNIVLKIIKGRY